MATVRHRSRIETDLPSDVREGLNRLLLEGATYEEVSLWCKNKGHDISRSSVGRYGKRFFEAYQNIKRFEDQSKAIMSGSDEGMPMEEAVGKLLLQKVMSALVDGSADITENSRLIADVAKLQSAHVQMAKWKGELESRAQKAANSVAAVVKKGGLSDEAVEEIRSRILGIVNK